MGSLRRSEMKSHTAPWSQRINSSQDNSNEFSEKLDWTNGVAVFLFSLQLVDELSAKQLYGKKHIGID